MLGKQFKQKSDRLAAKTIDSGATSMKKDSFLKNLNRR